MFAFCVWSFSEKQTRKTWNTNSSSFSIEFYFRFTCKKHEQVLVETKRINETLCFRLINFKSLYPRFYFSHKNETNELKRRRKNGETHQPQPSRPTSPSKFPNSRTSTCGPSCSRVYHFLSQVTTLMSSQWAPFTNHSRFPAESKPSYFLFGSLLCVPPACNKIKPGLEKRNLRKKWRS